MTHPMHFLSEGGRLTDEQWERLRRECSQSNMGPGPSETTFTFRARAINDTHDRVIVANRNTREFHCRPKPHCMCERGALECDCQEGVTCRRCGEKFVSISLACDSELCVNDDCPLCEHEREECGYQEILAGIREEALEEIRQGQSAALAHVGAVGSWLAPGVGDSPLFTCTIRILDELLGASHDIEHAKSTRGRGLRWECSDGSAVLNDPSYPGWLTWEDPPRETEEALQPAYRAEAQTVEFHARETAYLLDPGLDPRNQDPRSQEPRNQDPGQDPRSQDPPWERRETPDFRTPQGVLDSSRDLLDCLDGNRTPPETNRLGIPHLRCWNTALVMHQLDDLAIELDHAGPAFPQHLHLKALRELLKLAVSIARATAHAGTGPFLDAMVRGPEPPQHGESS